LTILRPGCVHRTDSCRSSTRWAGEATAGLVGIVRSWVWAVAHSAAVPGGRVMVHIPSVKTMIADPPVGLVTRTRLLDLLDQAPDHALVLVCAPPGYGKTSLLADGRPLRVGGRAGGRDRWRPRRTSRAGLSGTGQRRRTACAGDAGCAAGPDSAPSAEVPEPASDPRGGQPVGRGGSLPGAAQVGGQRAGESELGVGGDDDPGPAVRSLWSADLRGPAQGLLEQSEGVFEVEPAQERLPAAVDVGRGGAGGRGPQSHRLRVAVSR
jgi:hypothetical protein